MGMDIAPCYNRILCTFQMDLRRRLVCPNSPWKCVDNVLVSESWTSTSKLSCLGRRASAIVRASPALMICSPAPESLVRNKSILVR